MNSTQLAKSPSGDGSLLDAPYVLTPEDFKEMMAVWDAEGWPVQLLMRDHYSAKILHDNGVFTKIKFHKHEWKWDDENGLIILHKKTPETEPEWIRWDELLPSLTIKKNKKGELKFDGAEYGAEGLEYELQFHLSTSEFNAIMAKFSAEGWPVQFLLRDHYGAKVLYDNQVFALMDFYQQKWLWDDDIGLSIPYRATPNEPTEYIPWSEIAQKIPVCRTPQGWLLFDGWNYTQDGLVQQHLWQWPELYKSYQFPANIPKPSHCYLDLLSYCWEHEGMQGFGVRTPHGHLALEMGDDEGNFYSVGQYMDPRTKINTKVAPMATVKAVLMSPDPYMPSRGEKTMHRYSFGSGPEGRAKFLKLKKYIEGIQDFKKDPVTGIINTCGARKYNTISSNCGDFCRDIETYAQKELGAKLVKMTDDEVVVPFRHRMTEKEKFFHALHTNLWNRFILFLVDCLLWFVSISPWISTKAGKGTQDDFSDPYFNSNKKDDDEKVNFVRKLGRMASKNKPKAVVFPARMRVDQLYSPRLRNHSARLKS